MKTCFVSMPVGKKTDLLEGSVIDFDRVFHELVAPAIERAGLELRSWRSASVGASIQKQALSDIISSDVLLADITNANPNVMYELGARHAANRGPTVLIRGGAAPPPFYVAYLQTIAYDPAADLEQPEAFRARLTGALQSAARQSEGSPIYEFFPGLHVELPTNLRTTSPGDTVIYPEQVKQTLNAGRLVAPAQQRISVAHAEQELLQADKAAPAAYLDVLRGYRNASDWDALIDFAEKLPTAVAADPAVQQLLALALNRRLKPGDQERAVALMRTLIKETGGDAETLGILGRIFKDRWRATGDAQALADAIDCYGRSFDLQPSDHYAGFNAAALLFMQNDPAADKTLAALLPRVKEALQRPLEANPSDYWTVSTAVEIAVMERDWDEATRLVRQALSFGTQQWGLRASIESLERLGKRLIGPDADQLARLLETLRIEAEREARNYA